MTHISDQAEYRPYKTFSDEELADEIDFQQLIVNDLISFVKIIPMAKDWGSVESHEGLYYAFLRYRELTDELATRLFEKKDCMIQLKGHESK